LDFSIFRRTSWFSAPARFILAARQVELTVRGHLIHLGGWSCSR
jgi:hypothetical protein